MIAHVAYDKGRVSQSKYWAIFGGYMLLVPFLLIGGIYEIFRGDFLIGLLMVIAIAPLGGYFRVTMMRRCRDIGWPAFLPWLMFLFQFASGFAMNPMRIASGETSLAAAVGLPMILGLLDFVFSIVIGCIRSKGDVDYGDVFGPTDGPAVPARPMGLSSAGNGAGTNSGGGMDRIDEAFARALEAHRSAQQEPVLAQRGLAASPARPAGGFGRKVV